MGAQKNEDLWLSSFAWRGWRKQQQQRRGCIRWRCTGTTFEHSCSSNCGKVKAPKKNWTLVLEPLFVISEIRRIDFFSVSKKQTAETEELCSWIRSAQRQGARLGFLQAYNHYG
jgi:hypothetical protein